MCSFSTESTASVAETVPRAASADVDASTVFDFRTLRHQVHCNHVSRKGCALQLNLDPDPLLVRSLVIAHIIRSQWSWQQVGALLAHCPLPVPSYANSFERNQITGTVLSTLTKEDLDMLEVRALASSFLLILIADLQDLTHVNLIS